MRVPANAVRQGNVIQVSESVDPAVAALMEPFACVLRGRNAVKVKTGDVVLVCHKDQAQKVRLAVEQIKAKFPELR